MSGPVAAVAPAGAGGDGAPLLEGRGLRLRIDERRALEASLALRGGEALQLTGPSGCGKTTLLRLLARLDAADGGELLLRGAPARTIRAPLWRRQVVYLAQHPALLEGTVEDNLAAGLATVTARQGPARGGGADAWRERAAGLLRALLLDPRPLWHQEAASLSGGEAARVALIRALLIDPAVLLADEPTAALDAAAAAAVVALLGRWVDDGGALVLVAHGAGPWEALPRRRLDLEPAGKEGAGA